MRFERWFAFVDLSGLTSFGDKHGDDAVRVLTAFRGSVPAQPDNPDVPRGRRLVQISRVMAWVPWLPLPHAERVPGGQFPVDLHGATAGLEPVAPL